MSEKDSSEIGENDSQLLELADTLHESFKENPRGTIKPMNIPSTMVFLESDKLHEVENVEAEDGILNLHAKRSSPASGFTLKVKDPIGSGGMANVDAAIQTSLKREIALKRPREDRSGPYAIQALIREAQMMAQLDHPNIPPVHQLAFNQEGEPIIMMKRVRGTSWATLIHEPWHAYWANHKERHLRSHLEILRQVCHALEYAHDKGIIHRDLKSENVMIGDYGEVYLLDWGVAVELDENDQHQADHFCGTPCFAAPEMFSATTPLSKYTDVYLLGALLHELLTRNVLHDGKTFDEIIEQVRRSAPIEYFPDVHPTLARIANKATELYPEKRYQSVHEFREAIEHHLDHYQALELLNATIEKLATLETLVTEAEKDGFHFHQLAFECRFGFRRVFDIAPELAGSRKGLIRVLELQALYELAHGRTDAPRRIVHLIKKMKPDFEGIHSIQTQLDTLTAQKESSGELSTQIQYKLLEELRKKQDS